MQIGVVYPQTEIGGSAEEAKAFAVAAEDMGFKHIVAYDHVVGVDKAQRPGWTGTYDLSHPFHEPLVLFAYLAGVTKKIGLFTAIIILPQRQAVLVAKQAACVDLLSGGRLRLGVGTGWNTAEYQALGVPFNERGPRYEEQVEVMRALWTQHAVTFKGRFHELETVGLVPMPLQKPIPIWMGGGTRRPDPKRIVPPESVLRRIARLADGWVPTWRYDYQPGLDDLKRLREFRAEYGKDPKAMGFEGRITTTGDEPGRWQHEHGKWQELGATHMSIITMNEGLVGVSAHLRRLEQVRKALPV